ncbi:hypothetical protein FPV67DRAFT_1449982 [Lyophyllum atratum]|nr:hypothetical protein FPV67DRAFT_1449982 [Lyophyllum atratum]
MAVGRVWWPCCAGAVVVWLGVWGGAAGVRCRAVVHDVVGGLLGWLWLLAVTVVGGVGGPGRSGVSSIRSGAGDVALLVVRRCMTWQLGGQRGGPGALSGVGWGGGGRVCCLWESCWGSGAVTVGLRGVLGIVGRVLAVGAEGTHWGGGCDGGGGGG